MFHVEDIRSKAPTSTEKHLPVLPLDCVDFDRPAMTNQRDHAVTSSYRVHLIGHDGQIERSTSIEAENDEQAIAQARHLLNGKPVELWDQNRLVIKLAPKS